MPITRLTCPHCEQEVDLNLTSVTRSRDCPKCGKYIILQFTTKVNRTKRKALLMSTMELDGPAPAAAATAALPPAARRPAVVPAGASTSTVVPRRQMPAKAVVSTPLPDVAQTLEGSSGDRLQHDPEVRRTGLRLLGGILVVLMLVGLVVVADRYHWWDRVAETYSRIMLALSPPAKEAKTQAPEIEVDPSLPSTKEVLSRPSVPIPDVPVKSGTPSQGTGSSEQQKAMRTVAAFLDAKTLKDRVPMVRDANLVGPLMQRYYQTHDAGPIPYKEILPREVNPEGILSFAFQVVLASGELRRVVVAKAGDLSSPDGGRYVLDWTSFVIYSEMSWAELMDKRPVNPVLMRVKVKPSDYFNKYFPDSQGLYCLELNDPLKSDSPPLYGYVRKNTPLGAAITMVLRRAVGEPQNATVTVKYPEDSSSLDGNQVWIHELVADGWLVRGR